jgi:hypothetical protein
MASARVVSSVTKRMDGFEEDCVEAGVSPR